MDDMTQRQLLVFALVFLEGMKWIAALYAVRWIWRKLKSRLQRGKSAAAAGATATNAEPKQRFCATHALPPDHPSMVWAREHPKDDASPWREG